MILGPFLRLAVKTFDVLVEPAAVDPPDAAAPDLDRRKRPRPHQGVDLGDADVQVRGDVLIVLMTSALVVVIWGMAEGRLTAIVETALDTVCGRMGC